MNRPYFTQKFAYTLLEILKNELSQYGRFIDEDHIIDLIEDVHYDPLSPYKPSFIIDDASTKVVDPLVETLLQKIIDRYGEHYISITEKELITDEDYGEQVKIFMGKFCRVADYTYPRYSTLFKLYDDNKSQLMAKLQNIESETHQTSQSESHNNGTTQDGTTKINDTPQAENVDDAFAGDDYVSEIHKQHQTGSDVGQSSISGSGSVSRTHSSDPTTIMERISEIERKYSNLMLKWLNEFDKLFIEEGNV